MRLRKEGVAGVLLVVGMVPAPTPLGSLYLLEPAVYGMAILLLLRRGGKLKIPAVAGLALAVVGVLAIDWSLGIRGPADQAFHTVRAYTLIAAGVIVIANTAWSPPRWNRLVRTVGTLLAVLVVVEHFAGFDWITASVASGIDTRSAGPLGPGFTATPILAAAYLTLRSRRLRSFLLLTAALLLLASRAHLLGLAVLVAWEFRPARFKPSNVAMLLLGAVAAVRYFPNAVARITAIGSGDELERSRGFVWSAALDAFHLGDWLGGLGPSGFELPIRPGLTIGFAHTQYITPWLDAGLVGLALLVALVLTVWQRAPREFAVAILATCIAGEFLVGPTIPGNLGALVAWVVVLVPQIAEPPRRARRRRVRATV